jgi:SAM-dependent methyltransferase
MPDAAQEILDQLGSPQNFAHEWTSFPSIVPEYESQFEGWVSALDRSSFVGAYVVDAGCGTGRNTFWSLKWGARRVFAFDVDYSTVEVARENLKTFSTAEVACASIYRFALPDTEAPDIVMSIGVIHHLADPQLAVRRLVQSVREGGTVLLWVYGSEGNERLLRVLIPLRSACAKIPINTLKKLAGILTIPIFIYVRTPFPKSTYLQHVARFQFWHLHSRACQVPCVSGIWRSGF